MPLADAIRQEVELRAGFRTDEVLKLIEQNRVRGRIWMLRRGKALPKDEIEGQYLACLRQYVRHKIQSNRERFSTHRSLAEQYRDKMSELEARMTGEIWDSERGFLFSGHFSRQ